jgi:hypothetical protein
MWLRSSSILQNIPIYRGSFKARLHILEDRLQKVVFLRRFCDIIDILPYLIKLPLQMETAREIQKHHGSFVPPRFDLHERYFLTFQAVYELINKYSYSASGNF